MKNPPLAAVCIWLGLGLSAALRADEILPRARPATDFARMAARSPFAPPTAPVAVSNAAPPRVPGWADNLTATMIMRAGDKFMVTVVDSQNSRHLYLSSEPDQLTQMAVASVKWGANRDDPPIVTLSRGKEFAQVKYETGSALPGATNPLGGGGLTNPGAARNPGAAGPPIPGLPGYHPPGAPNNAQAANPVPSSVALRRPLIHAATVAVPPAGGRPPANQPNGIARPNPGLKVDDDDDDD